MEVLDELSSDQKYAISKIMVGACTLIGELAYCRDMKQCVTAAIAIIIEECGWISVDDVIEELKKYKEE